MRLLYSEEWISFLTDIREAQGGWSSNNTAHATINATTGVVAGVGAGTATISYIKTGCYTAKVITVNVCREGANGETLAGTDQVQQTYSLYPNPTSGQITNAQGIPYDKEVGITIFTYLGQTVYAAQRAFISGRMAERTIDHPKPRRFDCMWY